MARTPIILFLGIFIIFQAPIAQSFDTPTHSQLSNRAVLSSNVDNFLKTELNFPGGVQDPLLNGVTRSIIEWVQEGSIREDDSPRFCNHFHNPLRTWNQAGLQIGLNPICPTSNPSSVIWGQDPGNEFSWQKARESYFEGLKGSTKTDRDKNLALAFKTLGHLIHLVQDAAVPAHSRNDAHPPILNPDGFESFVDSIRTRLFNQLTSVVTKFDESILKLTTASSAPIPIARIIDTTDDDQIAAFPSAGTDIGLAEYSNANFLSNDTIFTDFVFPWVGSLGIPFKEKGDTYFPKIFDGELIDHFVAQDRKGNYYLSERHGKRYVPDSLIFTDYAARLEPPLQPNRLLPRAIGYSAGLIDYFFRGRMEVTLPEEQPSETDVLVKVKNTTPDEDTGNKEGQVAGVLRYLLSGEELFSVSDLRPLTLTSDLQGLVFNLIPPDGAEEAFLAIVYKGQLGLEEGAVMQGNTPLLILKPKKPTLVCPNGSVNFTAVGGKPPYTWSTTKLEITPSGDTKSAMLKPPVSNLAGVTAYLRVGSNCTGLSPGYCGHCNWHQQSFDCNDQPLDNCAEETWTCGFGGIGPACFDPAILTGRETFIYYPLQYVSLTMECTLPDACGLPPPVTQERMPFTSLCSAGAICDQRGKWMLDQGCKPCSLEMQDGATVTVTDATGASTKTTVTAQ